MVIKIFREHKTLPINALMRGNNLLLGTTETKVVQLLVQKIRQKCLRKLSYHETFLLLKNMFLVARSNKLIPPHYTQRYHLAYLHIKEIIKTIIYI